MIVLVSGTVKKQSSISLKAVILASLFISVALALILTVSLRFTTIFKPAGSSEGIEELYKAGKPELALAQLEQRSNIERGSAASLLWEGKLWYLTAFKRFNESGWSDYAKDKRDWFSGEDIDNAVHSLTRAQKSQDQREEALLFLALIFMEKGWFEKSQDKFLTLLKEFPANREGLFNYGVLLSRMHNFRKSVKVLKKGLEIYPDDPDFLKNLFWLYRFHLRSNKDAVYYGDKFLKSAKRSNPSIPEVKREIYDILSRFPEFESDTLAVYSEDIREFTPRKRVTPFK